MLLAMMRYVFKSPFRQVQNYIDNTYKCIYVFTTIKIYQQYACKIAKTMYICLHMVVDINALRYSILYFLN